MANQLSNFLINPSWLIIGTLLFLVVSMLKVHLIWYIQPKIYDETISNKFEGYFSSLWKALKGQKLYYGVGKYLFYPRGSLFRIIDEQINPIKKGLGMLKGISTFLIPYLIAGTVWFAVGHWIKSQILYDELQITLGKIQLLLNYLNSLNWIRVLIEYKTLILVQYGIVCVLIPFLYDIEKVTNKLKNLFSRSLIYLSIFLNVSFFGVLTSNGLDREITQLKALSLEIIEIHEDVLRQLMIHETAEAVITNVQQQEEKVKETKKRFNREIRKRKPKLDKSYSKEYTRLIRALAKNYDRYVLPESDQFKKERGQRNYQLNEYRGFIRKRAKASSTTDYITNEKKWNKKAGKAYQKKAKKYIHRTKSQSPIRVKLEKVLQVFFDYGFAESVDAVADAIGLSKNICAKQLIKILSKENYKNRLAQRVANWFVLPENRKFKYQLQFTPFTMTGSLNKLSDHLEELVVVKENELLKKTIENRINELKIVLPSNSEIMVLLNSHFLKHGDPLIKSDIEMINRLNDQYGSEYGFHFDTNRSLTDNIRKYQRKQYKQEFLPKSSLFSSIHDYNSSLNANSRLFRNQSSNLSLIRSTNTPMERMHGSVSKICKLCGLPYRFPICLALM